MRWPRWGRETSASVADGQAVWFWRRVPWKGTVLERVQVPSGKGRSGR